MPKPENQKAERLPMFEKMFHGTMQLAEGFWRKNFKREAIKFFM